MKFLSGIKEILSRSKRSLLTYGGESFSALSIVLIVFLDIFILTAVFKGIYAEKRTVLSVYEKFPYRCNSYFSSPDTIYDKYNIRKISLPQSEYKLKEVEPLCKELNTKIELLLNNKLYADTTARYKAINKGLRNLSKEIKNIEARYNTALFEKTAYVKSNNLIATKAKYEASLELEKSLKEELSALADLEQIAELQRLQTFIKNNASAFKESKYKYNRTKAFLEFLNVLKFTLPLILIFYFLYKRSESSESTAGKLGVLISSHTILINFIPLFFNTLYLIYHAIPKVFFAKLIAYLHMIGGIFLGYYFLIVVGIVIFAVAILVVQKRYKKKQELLQQKNRDLGKKYSLARSTCPNCLGSVRIDHDIFCPHCGATLKEPCKACGELRYSFTKYCQKCGKE
ncbi:MAG: zinc ribbon domain-containing protein [Sulfurimonas sp.]